MIYAPSPLTSTYISILSTSKIYGNETKAKTPSRKAGRFRATVARKAGRSRAAVARKAGRFRATVARGAGGRATRLLRWLAYNEFHRKLVF